MSLRLKQFIASYEARAVPLYKSANLASFYAAISGREEDYAEAAELELELGKLHANRGDFTVLKEIRETEEPSDPLLKRQLDVLYNAYLARQIPEADLEAIIRLQSEIEKKFSLFRAEIDGQFKSDNEIEELLKTSTDSRLLETAWLAHKKVGEVVADDVKRLVGMRNSSARSLGFANYHAMQLELSEQNPGEIETLFDELDVLTRNVFAEQKRLIDDHLSRRFGLPVTGLMPWHYQNRFFQEAPKILPTDPDVFYRDKDVAAITRDYYAGIGLPIDDLLARSDLYEKPGKNQHAFCTDIDKEGDVRVMCNIRPTHGWMNTMLHEYGHAVYDKYNDRSLPWALREPAHTFTTEAIAMMFGRLASNPEWLKNAAGATDKHVDEVASDLRNTFQMEQLVFSRWAQVMYRFEKAMYENPDRDLNALWWDLAERYQLLTRPENRNAPDWASKIHVALYPAYYHNYLLGELLASQLYAYIVSHVLGDGSPETITLVGSAKIGEYLRENVFRPGRTAHWSELIRNATGEPLTASWYAKQFVY